MQVWFTHKRRWCNARQEAGEIERLLLEVRYKGACLDVSTKCRPDLLDVIKSSSYIISLEDSYII
ncbi:unnamed protein product [Brassica rapa subsp. narinosa]